MTRYHLCWIITVLYMTLAGTAVGQPKPTPEDRFNHAVELAKAGDYQEAVEICHEVIERLPASKQSRVHKLLGYAYKKLDMLPNAWHYLTRYLAGKEDTTAGAWLRDVEASLAKTGHVKVSFSCRPEGLLLHIPASKPGVASHSAFRILHSAFVWWFVPGKHTVKATAADHKPRTVEIDVRERGDSGMREIRLARIVADSTISPSGLLVDPLPGDHSAIHIPHSAFKRPSRALKWTLLGSGLALGVTGGIFHGLGFSKNEDLHSKYLDSGDYPIAADAKSAYDKAYQDQVRPKEMTSYVLYGIGGAAIVAGVVTWLVSEPVGNEKSTAFSISPLPLQGGTGALMSFGF